MAIFSFEQTAKRDELHIGLGIPKAIAIEIHNWAEEQDWPEGTELEPIDEYHITMLYAPEGHGHKDDPWVNHDSHAITIQGIKSFPSKEHGEKDAIVLIVKSETIDNHHRDLANNAEDAGIEISPFSHDDFKPHMTIAYGSLPGGLKPPKLTFETESSSVSPPREETAEEHSSDAYKKRHKNDSHHATYMGELVKFADSWRPEDQWPRAISDGDMPIGEQPHAPECSCKSGHKLDCPVHGMNPVLPDYKDTLDFPDPNNPVGYDYHSEAPRTWMRAETSWQVKTYKQAKHKQLWLDDTRRPPDDSWDWARNVAEAIELTKGPSGEPKAGYKHMSLDHDLGIVKYEGKVVVNPNALDGGDFVLWLHEHGDKKHMPESVNIHSHNKHAVELMVKALEPHTKVTVKRAPDYLEEKWAREFKVHDPSEIEKEVVHLPEHVASNPPLDKVISEYEELGKTLNPKDGIWDCQTGANMMTHMLNQAGIGAETQVGRYWHPTPEARNRAVGENSDQRDELHYWTTTQNHLIDPNSEVRGEPRLQEFREASTPTGGSDELMHYQGQQGVYEPFWEESDGGRWDPIFKNYYDADELDPHKAAKYDRTLAQGIRRVRKTGADEADSRERLPERIASHQLAWLPGSNLKGKGLVTPSGDIHTWPVDKDGIPHYAEYVDQRQPYQLNEGTAHFFQIRPRGGLDTKGYNIPANAINHILQMVPSLCAGEHTDWHFGKIAGNASDAEMVPIEALRPFREFDRRPGQPEGASQAYWEALKAHIAEHGFEDPLTLEYNNNTGRAKLGEGNHRLGIAEELGMTHVPVSCIRTRTEGIAQLTPPNQGDEYGYFPGNFTPSQVGLPISEKPYQQAPGNTPQSWYPTQYPERYKDRLSGKQAADEYDTREYPDSRRIPPATMQEPAQGNPHPEKQGCTCDQGHKLDCPVHGLYPTEQGYDHSWSIPQGHPVGYPQNAPDQYKVNTGARRDFTYWHLTHDRNFRIDPSYVPNDLSSISEESSEPGWRPPGQSRIGQVSEKYQWSFQIDDPEEEPIVIRESPRSDGEEVWTGLPRAEGAIEDRDEHKDN